jgi:hypothetical protein
VSASNSQRASAINEAIFSGNGEEVAKGVGMMANAGRKIRQWNGKCSK